jgi:hypothetical protein
MGDTWTLLLPETRTLVSLRQERLNGEADFIRQERRRREPPDHMAPIQIAMEMRKVLMQTSEMTS